TAFISVNDNDKRQHVVQIARDLADFGYKLIGTEGTREFLMRHGVDVTLVWKVHEGPRPHVVDRMINREVTLVIKTPLGKSAFVDDGYIRKNALQLGIPCITTLSAATACVEGMRSRRDGESTIAALQDQHSKIVV